MAKIVGCLYVAFLILIIGAGFNALLAIPISWALDSFAPWHLSYLTVFVLLCIIAIVFGGGKAASSK